MAANKLTAHAFRDAGQDRTLGAARRLDALRWVRSSSEADDQIQIVDDDAQRLFEAPRRSPQACSQVAAPEPRNGRAARSGGPSWRLRFHLTRL